MKVEMGFGTTVQSAEISEKNILDILMPNPIEHGTDEQQIVKNALQNPISSEKLSDYNLRGKRVVILSSDISRPMPTYKVMPQVLDALYDAGAVPENITLVFGLGSHRKQTDEERKRLAGERAFYEIKCADSDPDDCIRFGITQYGTPVDITRSVAEADFRICLGNIEYHYFAGYSGGAKALMPGVSTPEAIQVNHKMMINPLACAGNLDNNPIRDDIEEAGKIVGIDYILNVVLDEHKNIVYAVCGDAIDAHREGCKFLDNLYLKKVDERADIVIVSQGGAPKDLNLYQTQKALDNAKHVIKEGGVIIVVGSCKEGMGQKTFEEWMVNAKTPGELTAEIKRNFKLGGHKAAAIAMILEIADIYLVSEMNADFVESIFMKPFDNLQMALDKAIEKMGEDASILVMPYGGSTLPRVEKR